MIGGNVTHANGVDTYASTIKTENIRIFYALMTHFNLSVLGGDIGTTYLNAYTKERIFTMAGIEFGEHRVGMKLELKKGLYSLKCSANAWYFQLSRDIEEIGFKKSRIDSIFWYRKNPN